MNDRTEEHDSNTRPDVAIDKSLSGQAFHQRFSESVHELLDDRTDPDLIRVARPAGLTDEAWNTMKDDLFIGIETIVETVTGRCAEFSWCRDVGNERHEKFHSGDLVDLANSTFCWPVFRREDGEPHVLIEGPGREGEKDRTLRLTARSIWFLLRATATPEARAALAALLDELGETE